MLLRLESKPELKNRQKNNWKFIRNHGKLSTDNILDFFGTKERINGHICLKEKYGNSTCLSPILSGLRLRRRCDCRGLLGCGPPPHALDDLEDLVLLVGVGLLVNPVATRGKRGENITFGKCAFVRIIAFF